MAYNRKRLKFTLIFIVVIALFAGLIDWHSKGVNSEESVTRVPEWVPFNEYWNKFDYHLGLDLRGGTHLVYQADTGALEESDKDSAVEGVRDVIERRVNAFGVAEPLVQTNKGNDDEYRIIVELAGVSDVNEAISMIGETPLLEFKEQNPEYLAERELTEEQQAEMNSYNEEAKKRANDILSRAVGGEDFGKLASEFSEDPASAVNNGELGWVSRGVFVPEFDKAIFDELKVGEITPALVRTQFGYHIIKKNDEREMKDGSTSMEIGGEEFEVASEGVDADGNPVDVQMEAEESFENKEVLTSHILIKTKSANDFVPPAEQWINTELSGKHLDRSVVQYDPNTNDPEVSLEFNEDGAELFSEITARNIGKPVAIFLDGYPISVPNVNEKITGGKAIITGRFNLEEARTLVQRLNAGALPVPINLISQQTIGPSLGQASVAKSLKAGIIGLLLVAVFMLLIYRIPGIFAVVALAIYTAIVLMIFKLIPVTLTLAGIAGFVLSIGMAVDANVLIFERVKEEVKNGKRFGGAVEEGFRRAWTSIRDSNISSLLTCFVLYWFGTSVIRGFAVTLGIGILISMFSAITITRIFLRLVGPRAVDKTPWLFGVRKSEKKES